MSVAASGTATLTYQWRKNTFPIGGATSSTYLILTTSETDAGSYDCIVTNGCGSAPSDAVSLTITSTPAITAQPADAAVCGGGSASFSVSAADATSYQWQIETPPVGSEDWNDFSDGPVQANSVVVGTATGASTSSLVFQNGTSSFLRFRANAGNACGLATSDPALLRVNSADFNGDGDIGTDADIAAFFACISGNCCATCGTADFNADGDIGTDADVEAFFRVLAGGGC